MNANEQGLRQIGTRPPRPDGVDKVTGRARYGADYTLPGMVWGRVLRSPHAHARILGIDASAALALPGVLAVVTAEDFLAEPKGDVASGEAEIESGDLSRNVMAREKALYHGHAVAAVAATTPRIAAAALAAIRVDYEALPAVLDIDAAIAPDAPLLHADMFTRGVDPEPRAASNVAAITTLQRGDLDAGFAAAEVVVEGTWCSPMAHQGYIEPQACLAWRALRWASSCSARVRMRSLRSGVRPVSLAGKGPL